jgi:hypothetical protein
MQSRLQVQPMGLCVCLVWLLAGLSATAMSGPEHGKQRLPLSAAPATEAKASDGGSKAEWTWAGIEEEDGAADAPGKARFASKHKKHHRHDLHQHLSKQPHNRTGEHPRGGRQRRWVLQLCGLTLPVPQATSASPARPAARSAATATSRRGAASAPTAGRGPRASRPCSRPAGSRTPAMRWVATCRGCGRATGFGGGRAQRCQRAHPAICLRRSSFASRRRARAASAGGSARSFTATPPVQQPATRSATPSQTG